MYEFTIEDNKQVMNAMVANIMNAIVAENPERIEATFDFARMLYEIENADHAFNADVKTALTLHIARLPRQLTKTGSTFISANRITKGIVHEFVCNWFRKYDIEVYR